MVDVIQRRKLDKTINEAWLIGELKNVAPDKLDALFIPTQADGTTAKLSPDGLIWTYANAPTKTVQGHGVLINLNGSTQKINTPDVAKLSHVEPLAFSVIGVAKPTSGATTRPIFTKGANGGGATGQEYYFRYSAADKLEVALIDDSAGVGAVRTADSANIQGSLACVGFTYTGGGGATAANGITLIENNVEVASTAFNDVSYVAMENLTSLPTIGGTDAASATPQWYVGALGIQISYSIKLEPRQYRQVTYLLGKYYGVKF